MHKLSKTIGFAGIALLGGAVFTELRKPPEERTGEGTVGGVVPYDLRPPTTERLRERMWNPDDDRLFTPHVFGVGWSINLGSLARRLDLV